MDDRTDGTRPRASEALSPSTDGLPRPMTCSALEQIQPRLQVFGVAVKVPYERCGYQLSHPRRRLCHRVKLVGSFQRR